MKFTEEQYQKIIEIADEYQSNSAFGIIGDTMQNSIGAIFFETELCNEIDFYESAKEMMAIFNPLTRKWAHEQFVEEEKKYLWTTPLVAGIKYALIKENGKYVLSDMYLTGKGTPLTELEVVNIGLKTDWFNKEEVE